MELQEIITAFGAYYIAGSENQNRIKRLLTQGLVTPKSMTLAKTDDTIYRMAQLNQTRIVQPFQLGWTPINIGAFVPNEIRLFHFKVDTDLQPDEIVPTWLGFLADNSLAKKDFPLVKYLIENDLIPTIQKDMEMSVYGHGQYVVPTPGVAGPVASSMNGIIYLLHEGVNAGTINSVPLGALNKDTIFDQVEAFIDGISQLYQNEPMEVFMSQTWFKHYLRDKRVSGFYTKYSDKEIDNGIDFTVQSVKALPSLHDSDVIFATPKLNFLHLTKNGSNASRFLIEESHRTVSILTDWWEGIGFGMDAAVWTNILPAGSGSASV